MKNGNLKRFAQYLFDHDMLKNQYLPIDKIVSNYIEVINENKMPNDCNFRSICAYTHSSSCMNNCESYIINKYNEDINV